MPRRRVARASISWKHGYSRCPSVEIALSRFCGPRDIITPISREDEVIRGRLGYRGAQNYFAPLRDWRIKDIAKFVLGKGGKKRFYNHIQGEIVKAYVGDAVWNDYFKFCIERNPFDKCVSNYYWTHRNEPRPPLSAHIDLHAHVLKSRGYYLYTINGEVAVDKVCRFENLEQDLEDVRKIIGLPSSLELPNAKTKYRKDKSHYRGLISPVAKSKISSMFSQEMQLFGYEW